MKETGVMCHPKDIPMRQKEQFIQLPKIIDDRGNLSFIEEETHIPFKIARSYWIYDVPGGEIRGSHAFREQEEFIVALSGSFDLVLNDGVETRRYSLNRSYMGVYVPRMMWRTLENFSTNSLCLVLSSTQYDPDDYIWEYDTFKQLKTLGELSAGTAIPGKFAFSGPFSNLANPLESTVYNCNVFELPKEHNRAGNLTALNNEIELPFEMKRVFYIYDIPSGATRGAHAHKEVYQFIIAASSSFDILLDDGHNRKVIHLDRPNNGLLVLPGIWCQLLNFSSAAVCMVLTSEKYNENDYIRKYTDFISFKSWK